MRLLLAPMEGVVDWVLRDLYTEIGGIDQCVTEFIRVTTQILPDTVYYRYAPELHTDCKTRSGTPVFIQLLGGDPSVLAENAAFAASLGAIGIDLNFGCPAKTVNRHDGGAAILKTPDRLQKIVESVRQAVPLSIPVTAKIRLGFDDPSHCRANAEAAQSGGANWLTVHARTKTDGYRPPAYWEWIPRLRETVQIPIIANGEIWNVEDYFRCREVSGSNDVMIGRGAIARPFLFQQIRAAQALLGPSAMHQRSSEPAIELNTTWKNVSRLIPKFYLASENFRSPQFAVARTKQWMRQLCLNYPEAQPLFDELKLFTNPALFREGLEKHLS